MLALPSGGVAPRAGAWIEMHMGICRKMVGSVAPRAGAWIEIKGVQDGSCELVSLPVRERGLK